MILVSLARTWPVVLSGDATAEQATRGAWPARPSEIDALSRFADAILGVFRGEVVAAFDIAGWQFEAIADRSAALRQGLGRKWPRVIFDVVPSQSRAGWVGRPNPGRPFTQWPVQYLDTASLVPGRR